MATKEIGALLSSKIGGVLNLIYPITKSEYIADFDAAARAACGAIIVTATMTAAGWNKATKQYSFESAYPFAQYDLQIEPNDTCTSEQREAWDTAKINGSVSTNIVKAYGDIPTVNIPIIVKAVKK